MTNVVVIGAQWGDEGKGKVVDWLSERADVVVRFQGGHNAGHTLVVNGEVFKLHLLPSGVLRDDKLSIIGDGVVIDIEALNTEIEKIEAQGVKITPEKLRISKSATIILPTHTKVDGLKEKALGDHKIGTTQRGIGPAYVDHVARVAVKMGDLNNPEYFRERFRAQVSAHNLLLKAAGEPEVDIEEMADRTLQHGRKLLPYLEETWQVLHQHTQKNSRILFEGAQGVYLDVTHGTYPFVTSSNTLPAAAALGAGVGTQQLHYILGIVKAYTTRVGAGPFPSEQVNDIGETLGRIGHEFGTTTGRKRRCGWLDAVMLRQSVIRAGIQGIVLTKLDVLDEFEEIKICTAYKLDGKMIDYFPSEAYLQARLEPVYETIPGWKSKTQGMRSLDKLPLNAVNYVKRIEELVGAPIALISTSPEREDMIVRQDPYEITPRTAAKPGYDQRTRAF